MDRQTRVVRSEDGTCRWEYDVDLFTNPGIFLLIWKIFFFILLGIFTFILLIDLFEGDLSGEVLLNDLKFFGYLLAGMTVLVGLGYLVYAAIMGGKYCVEFTMDEKGINHSQTAPQAEKARRLGAVTAIAGAAAGKPGTVGVGLNAQRTEMYTEFSKVRTVKSCPRRHLIKLNETLQHNQVYVGKEDFAFVENFILTHCENLRKRN